MIDFAKANNKYATYTHQSLNIVCGFFNVKEIVYDSQPYSELFECVYVIIVILNMKVAF